MADLSPAAQSVKDAVLTIYPDNVPKDDSLWALERPSTVAALRAAANQAHPKAHIEDIDYVHQSYVHGWKDALDVILAIATELDGTNNTSQEDYRNG